MFSNETSFKYIPLQSRSRSVTMDHLLMNISQTWESCIVGKKLVDTCNDVRRGPLEVKDYLWCRSPYGCSTVQLFNCSTVVFVAFADVLFVAFVVIVFVTFVAVVFVASVVIVFQI